jgi:hypothetical protein
LRQSSASSHAPYTHHLRWSHTSLVCAIFGSTPFSVCRRDPNYASDSRESSPLDHDRWGDARMRLRGRRQCHRLGGLHYGCSSARGIRCEGCACGNGCGHAFSVVRRFRPMSAGCAPHITVGAYVEVTERKDWQTNIVVATVVEARYETGQTVSGAGVIDRVIVTVAEPIFRADGWL